MGRFGRDEGGEAPGMRAMALTWAVILVGGIAYFTVIGLVGN